MADRLPNLDADQRRGQRQCGETNTTAQLRDAATVGGDRSARDATGGVHHQLQQRRDVETVTFTSPYYDPFGEEGELGAELLGGAGGGRLAGTVPATVQAYDSTGARRF
uniref:Uncharacterized protein n=1 Tax=Opuntia streptacantha TaxID=393608 RepID=A0A7C9DXT0_OPUST